MPVSAVSADTTGTIPPNLAEAGNSHNPITPFLETWPSEPRNPRALIGMWPWALRRISTFQADRCSDIWNGRRDEEAVDEVAGSKADPHSLKRLEVGDKVGSVFRGKHPETPIFNDVQRQVPRSGAILVQNLAVHDLQTV